LLGTKALARAFYGDIYSQTSRGPFKWFSLFCVPLINEKGHQIKAGLEKLGFAVRFLTGQGKVIVLANLEVWIFYHTLLIVDSNVRNSRAFEVTQTKSRPCAGIPAGIVPSGSGAACQHLPKQQCH
jgi:hypothetical protein